MGVKLIKFTIILWLAGFLLAACGKKETCREQPDVITTHVELEIERLESKILGISSMDELITFFNKEPVIREYFFKRQEYPNDSIFYNEILYRLTNPYIDSLRLEIEQHFVNLDDLEQQFEEAFSLMKHYFPETVMPQIKTVATGFDYDLYVSDTLIVIGLDYYMGKGAKYRPMDTYNYILARYEERFIVPSVMLLYGISQRYNNMESSTETVLSDIITYGKAFYFAGRMLPCTPDSTLIWYSAEEAQNIKENQDIVWAHFLENQLLYQTDHLVKRKYIDERPKTFEIGPECPPRVGTWLGWEIVKQYMEKSDGVTLPQLMQTDDAQTIFDVARYRPER